MQPFTPTPTLKNSAREFIDNLHFTFEAGHDVLRTHIAMSDVERFASATVQATVSVIEAGARIGPRSRIGAGAWIGAGVILGADCVVGPTPYVIPVPSWAHAWCSRRAR